MNGVTIADLGLLIPELILVGTALVLILLARRIRNAGRASSVADFHDHWQRMFDWFAEHFDGADPVDRRIARRSSGRSQPKYTRSRKTAGGSGDRRLN